MIENRTPKLEALLTASGIEIYQTVDENILIAERIRHHMMFSGIQVRVGEVPVVRFVAKAQESDFPKQSAETLYQMIREQVATAAEQAGFSEVEKRQTELRNPVNEAELLDVWSELVYEREVSENKLAETVRWALELNRDVLPE